MSRKDKKDELDTETTFAEMNLESFKWYDPSKKKPSREKKVAHRIKGKEYRRMVRAAFAAFLPYFAIFILSMGVIVALGYLWLSC